MTRIAYVNHRYVSQHEAKVHIEDRGYQFADGVYEVITYYNRILVDGDLHVARLVRSLEALDIAVPMSLRALSVILHEVMDRNNFAHGSLYVQVTRGVAKRDHIFQSAITPSLVITATREKPVKAAEVSIGTEVIIRDDIRWLRRDIKSVALLPNVLLKNEATKLGKREAWLIDGQGNVTEGSVSNAFIVDKNGVLITRNEEICLLAGITRHRILEIAKEAGIPVELRPFTPQEAKQANEAFLSSSTSHLVPIIKIDDTTIGEGKPGAVFHTLFGRYIDYIEHETGKTIWQLN
ncbi:MAG: D-amino-acid transaminase [Alphaproteobacteria bacterium]|nr:D-amino-acid transaminase [Alphaproteobacteria bacterium]